MKTILRDVVITLLIAVVVYLGLRMAVQSFTIDQPSMLPNLQPGEWIVVNKVVYRLHTPQRGDVIVFRSPHDRNSNLIKRVIGLPGESVELRDGTVYVKKVSGETVALVEDYIAYPDTRPFVGQTIPEDQYFVLGDNRRVADDSRYGWLVPEKDIIGKAWLSTWPPGNWGLAPNHRPVEEALLTELWPLPWSVIVRPIS
jgi:signal peptidase I